MYKVIEPGTFEAHNHWYPKALNSTIHPLVAFFLNLSKERLVERYCHLNPKVNRLVLNEILNYQPKYFRWAGADLINVTTEMGNRQMTVIENNSCPSGQKSMPLLDEHNEMGGYQKLIRDTFIPGLKGKRLSSEGHYAVIYDKNYMEVSGYAHVLADELNENVFLIEFPEKGFEDYLRFEKGVLQLKTDSGWVSIKAAFRYVTQKPWSRIPIQTKTHILNPVLACISGGRNKMVAAKAYDIYNAELEKSGLKIQTPETIWDVSKNEIPLWVKKLGGQAVIKVPYSNAGQGVYTIVNESELTEFMKLEFTYDLFIVQSLIGNYEWSSTSSKGKFYHVGTIPTIKTKTYVCDVRMMVSATANGIRPLSVYARRAKLPLPNSIKSGENSWDILGTNLSYKNENGTWNSDTSRLMLMDRRDFNLLGISLDDMIEGFVQTVLSMIAIDKMSATFVNSKGQFKDKLFRSMNNDDILLDEILMGTKKEA